MREDARVRLVELGLTAIGTLGIIGVLGVVIFIAFYYFNGWHILIALAGQLALLVVAYHMYRWMRYPGLFQSKSSVRLIREVVLTVLLVYSLQVIAILAKLHIAGFIDFDGIAVRLGLDFKFKKRQLVQVSAVAPSGSHPGDVGRVVAIRVIAEINFSQALQSAGEVIYSVQFADEVVPVAEQYILPVSSVRPILSLG